MSAQQPVRVGISLSLILTMTCAETRISGWDDILRYEGGNSRTCLRSNSTASLIPFAKASGEPVNGEAVILADESQRKRLLRHDHTHTR
jgi:hypothetical protein